LHFTDREGGVQRLADARDDHFFKEPTAAHDEIADKQEEYQEENRTKELSAPARCRRIDFFQSYL
jgi:hypothetical protein